MNTVNLKIKRWNEAQRAGRHNDADLIVLELAAYAREMELRLESRQRGEAAPASPKPSATPAPSLLAKYATTEGQAKLRAQFGGIIK